MWTADKIGYRGNTNFNRAYEGDELVWEKLTPPPPAPANNEIWYTSTDGEFIKITFTPQFPPIISNTYVDGKGIIIFKTNLTEIGGFGLASKETLYSIFLPNTLTSIGYGCFWGDDHLTDITYNGTKAQWNRITKGHNWNYKVPATVVHCSDGDAPI